MDNLEHLDHAKTTLHEVVETWKAKAAAGDPEAANVVIGALTLQARLLGL